MRTTLSRLALIAPVTVLLALASASPAHAAPTTITGQASPTTAVAGTALTVTDTVTLTGDTTTPTGTVTFSLFDNATCTGTPVLASSPQSITPTTGTSATSTYSTSWTPATAGTFHWQAAYSGDGAGNDPATTVCAAPTQQVVVAQAQPTLTGNAFPVEIVDGVEATLTNVATFTEAASPTGVVLFALFDNDACDGDPVFEDEAPISGNQATLVADVTPEGAGEYFWALYYEGDANNEEAGSCGGPNQLLMVALNPDLEPQQPGPLTPVLGPGDGGGEQLPATGPAPVLELTLLALGLILLGTSAVGFGSTTRTARRVTA